MEKLNCEQKKRIVKSTVWNVAVYAAETLTWNVAVYAAETLTWNVAVYAAETWTLTKVQ